MTTGILYRLLAAIKRRGADGPRDDGSFARIPERHPSAATGTGLDSLDPRECQYHVHLFDDGDGVEVYGQYEVHPSPYVPTWDLSRPYPRHYNSTWDGGDAPREEWTYLRGVGDWRVMTLLGE